MASFKIGQIVKVKYTNFFSGQARTFSGEYEIMRGGARYYLFSNANGIDWYPTKKELEQAIANYKN